MDPLDRHLGTAAIVPPLGLGSLFLVPSLTVCLICLVGALVMGVAAVGWRRGFIAPSVFSLLSLAIVLAALAVRSVLS